MCAILQLVSAPSTPIPIVDHMYSFLIGWFFTCIVIGPILVYYRECAQLRRLTKPEVKTVCNAMLY